MTRLLPIDLNKAVDLTERGLLSTYEALVKLEADLKDGDELHPIHPTELEGAAFGRYKSKPISSGTIADNLRTLMNDGLVLRTPIDMPGLRTTYGYLTNTPENQEFIDDFYAQRRKEQNKRAEANRSVSHDHKPTHESRIDDLEKSIKSLEEKYDDLVGYLLDLGHELVLNKQD